MVKLSALRTGRLYAYKISLVTISVKRLSRAIVHMEGLSQWKIPTTPPGIDPATYRLQWLRINQIRHRLLSKTGVAVKRIKNAILCYQNNTRHIKHQTAILSISIPVTSTHLISLRHILILFSHRSLGYWNSNITWDSPSQIVHVPMQTTAHLTMLLSQHYKVGWQSNMSHTLLICITHTSPRSKTQQHQHQ
jgi:hypothetical protein